MEAPEHVDAAAPDSEPQAPPVRQRAAKGTKNERLRRQFAGRKSLAGAEASRQLDLATCLGADGNCR